MSSNFLLDKGRVAENLQKECFCYFIKKESVGSNLHFKAFTTGQFCQPIQSAASSWRLYIDIIIIEVKTYIDIIIIEVKPYIDIIIWHNFLCNTYLM